MLVVVVDVVVVGLVVVVGGGVVVVDVLVVDETLRLVVVLLVDVAAGWVVELVVVETISSWTNTSYARFASPATRLVAVLWNATKRPSAERAGPALASFPWVPSEAPLTRSVVPVCRSWTNTSVAPFVSPATRLVAKLTNATKRPSAESAGGKAKLRRPLLPLPWVPSEATLTRSVVPVCRSWTNTSDTPLVSPATRSVAALSKATKRPSAERAETRLASLPSVVPSEATLTRSVICAPAERPQRAVSRTRVTALRTCRCVGRKAPPPRHPRASDETQPPPRPATPPRRPRR